MDEAGRPKRQIDQTRGNLHNLPIAMSDTEKPSPPSSEVQRWMAETLRKCGWDVENSSTHYGHTSYRVNKDGLDAPANQLCLPARAQNLLAGLYGSGKWGYFPEGREKLSNKSYKDGELRIRDLLEDICFHEDVFLDTRNLGKVTLHNIKKALAAADKHNSYTAQLAEDDA